MAEDTRVATVDMQQRGQHLEHCGLARAVGTEHAEDLALGDGEVDPVDRSVRAKGLHEVVGIDGECPGGHRRGSCHR